MRDINTSEIFMKKHIDIIENDYPGRTYQVVLSEGAKKALRSILKEGGCITNGKYKGHWVGLRVQEEEILCENISTAMYSPKFLGYKYRQVGKYKIYRQKYVDFRRNKEGEEKVRLVLKELYM